MTRTDLVREFRVMTQDQVAPYLWETADVERWLAEAEQEAAIRGRLLHESSDPDMCEVAVIAGEASYPLHPKLCEMDHIAIRDAGSSGRRRIKLVSTEYLDGCMRDWRDRVGRVEYGVLGDTSIRLVPKPSEPCTLLLEGYRLPRDAVAGAPLEIHPAHHRYLLDWVLFRAFSVPDAESLDLNRAAQAEAAFTRYFGSRPDSDLRRITHEDTPHHNQAWI